MPRRLRQLRNDPRPPFSPCSLAQGCPYDLLKHPCEPALRPEIGSVASLPAAAPSLFCPGICPSNLCQKTQLTCLKTVFCGDIAPTGVAQCLTICKNLLTSTCRRVIYSRVRTASLRRSVGHTFLCWVRGSRRPKEHQRRNGPSEVKVGRNRLDRGPHFGTWFGITRVGPATDGEECVTSSRM